MTQKLNTSPRTLLRMIRTFVFLDLETTGMIKKGSVPKITEMSLIAVSRNEICNRTDGLPRVLHKLILPVNPKIQIPEVVQSLTGLSNENLKEVLSMEYETCDMVLSFLQRLAVPICFVAHNGNRFDYPILLHEFQNLNKVFGEDTLSIDTLPLFKDFYNKNTDISQKERVGDIPSTSITSMDVDVLMNDGCDEILSKALDSILNKDLSGTSKHESVSSKECVSLNMQETVVKSECTIKTPHVNYYKEMQKINEKTPESQIIKVGIPNENVKGKEKGNARRRLDFARERPCNFKLSTIYQHMCKGHLDNAHSAEGDCLMMLHCACKIGSFFVEWADQNALPLVSYKLQ